MPVATKTAGPRIYQWDPLPLQHRRNYRIIVKMITMNLWEARNRIDVRWTDAGRDGKSVATVISPSRVIQWLILSSVQLRIYLVVEH